MTFKQVSLKFVNIVFIFGMIGFAIAGWMRPTPEPDCTRWKFGKTSQAEDRFKRIVPHYEGVWVCIEGRLAE